MTICLICNKDKADTEFTTNKYSKKTNKSCDECMKDFIKCATCKQYKSKKEYTVNKKNGNLYAGCNKCRKTQKEWKTNNKDRTSKYNKHQVQVRNNNKKTEEKVQARKVGDHELNWVTYDSQREAAKKLKVHTSNVNKVIKGQLKQTGGYEFKIVTQDVIHKNIESWEEKKKDENIIDVQKGKPSPQRKSHEFRKDDNGLNIEGKVCGHCEIWKPLDKYNISNDSWDNLKNNCIDCFIEYRKNNKENYNAYMRKYEKKRKLIDVNFRQAKKYRSMLNGAIRSKNLKRCAEKFWLTDCTINFLKGWLEAKFDEKMTWNNYGTYWTIDHIIPCGSYDLTNENNVKECFHYKNLQPLEKIENIRKSNKLDHETQKKIKI